MGRPPGTSNGYERKITKVREQEITATTAEPIQMRSTGYQNRANNKPGRCGKHYGSMKSNGEIPRIVYQKYTIASKRMVGYLRDKVTHEK